MSATRTYEANPVKLPPGTLVDLFFGAVERHNLEKAQLYRTADGWRAISHQQLLADVNALGDGLLALGIEPGDRVGLLSENRPEWALADYAMLCTGVLNVPLYPTLPANQMAFIMADAGVRAVFVSNQEQLEKIRECRRTVSTVQHVIVFDDIPTGAAGELSLSHVLDLGRGGAARTAAPRFRERAKSARPDDVATIIYTSGTTGQPKGVMLTHNNIYSNVLAQSWMKAPTGEPFVAVSFLPLSHVFQRMVDYCLFHLGCTIAYSTIENAVASLGEVKPTIAVAVPRVYEKLYAAIMSATGVKKKLVLWARQVALDWADAVLSDRRPGAHLRFKHAIADKLVFSKVRAKIGGRLRFFVSGGAPLPVQIAKFLYGAGILVLEGYGLTETSPVIAVNTTEAMRLGTVGQPIANTEIAIAEDGEILARGPQIMKGYYKNPEATREIIDADGWFHTGDIGQIDADGFLTITDRKKDLIVTAGGKNIAPAPIQNSAKLSRFVTDALMIGDKRPYPVLLVVPDFDVLNAWAAQENIDTSERNRLVQNARVHAKIEDEVMKRLAGLARYEMPKKLLVLPREFEIARGEITPKLSVRRHVVEKSFQENIDALYAEASHEKAEAS
ncbi:MAG: AMP-dependent synthetase/ligase [Gemmatimonadota bacterium]